MQRRNNFSLTSLELVPANPENAPLLIMLHGYGSNEKDLIQIAHALPPEFRYISPRAPLTMDFGMYGWFPLEFTPGGITVDYKAAQHALQHFIYYTSELIREYRPAGNKVFLMGFSQGAVMSYLTAFNAPELLHGVIALSGQLPEKSLPIVPAQALLRKLPFLVMHGLYDDILPIAKGRSADEWLKQNVDDLTYREYPVAHQISDSGIELIRSWLKEKMPEQK